MKAIKKIPRVGQCFVDGEIKTQKEMFEMFCADSKEEKQELIDDYKVESVYKNSEQVEIYTKNFIFRGKRA